MGFSPSAGSKSLAKPANGARSEGNKLGEKKRVLLVVLQFGRVVVESISMREKTIKVLFKFTFTFFNDSMKILFHFHLN